MSGGRAESQPGYGRRRSNTVQSIRPVPAPPLNFGDFQVLNSWVHEMKPDADSRGIKFNHSYWPGVREGDMVSAGPLHGSESFVFFVPHDDQTSRQMMISIPKPMADAFKLKNNAEVLVTKVDPALYSAEFIELIFQDQYLGRSDMWRLGEYLVGQCVYANQEVSFIGGIVAKIQAIYMDGKQVQAACVTTSTKSIFRSLSAKITIFIQVCQELWEFAGDGERYNEKIVHSFLPALFAKWHEANTSHTVTIVLISRVFYEPSEREYAAGPLQYDDLGQSYKDFYKVITDLEVIPSHGWKPTLVSLKTSFWDFQRDILLTHHYHQDGSGTAAEQVRLVGRLSYAHDGPLLEALNMALKPTETHYIDRSLTLTGSATIVITPGTGYYRVSKQLLRLTTTRMLDQGFGLDLICLAKHPLHQSPIFSFRGAEVGQSDRNKDGAGAGGRASDPLWGGDDEPARGEELREYWWEPFWVFVSFWDQQMDLPFRRDRFVARAKMHEIQMLGLLEHDIISGIEVPFLPASERPSASPVWDGDAPPPITKAEADQFDLDIFALKPESKMVTAPSMHRDPWLSATSGGSSAQLSADKRASQRSARLSASIIEESPRTIYHELPPEKTAEGASLSSAASISNLSTSPSQSSIRSARSTASRKDAKRTTSVASKLAPSWLFNPFRSTPSEPQTTSVSASASSTSSTKSAAPSTVAPSTGSSTTLVSRAPVPIKNGNNSPSAARTLEDDPLTASRSSYIRKSPINTPPRDEANFAKRRSATLISASSSLPGSSNVPTNPTRLDSVVSYTQTSLARRWEHIFPTPLFKHDVKWSSIVTPACLPLTVSHFPSAHELETAYDMFSYDFVLDPAEMHSFMVERTHQPKKSPVTETVRREWALSVMRGMAAVRLAQGFQFILRDSTKPSSHDEQPSRGNPLRRGKSFVQDVEETPRPRGASEVLRSASDSPVFLCMSNEIHRISYVDETIQVRRYVRRMPQTLSYEYKCLIWPKLGGGYTQQQSTFTAHGMENYGWNSLDMLVAGYQHQFNESLRYWRTRFVVIPTAEPPSADIGPPGEKLNDEEMRIIGIEKLAEQFTKLRWQSADEDPAPPVRFLWTTLNPAVSVLDEALMEQLDQIHTAGPLKKNMRSEKEISDMSLVNIAKAMRSEGGVPIKHYVWHKTQYPNAFTGHDFVSWLVREFSDVSSRSQATEWGLKLEEQGLFEHCRGNHTFLDGHYFYRFKGEYSVPMTPRNLKWFGSRLIGNIDPRAAIGAPPPPTPSSRNFSGRQNRRRLILSQSMVIDIDPNKKSDQAESVVLHHDIIHNPGTVFHFELQWIGTTARCIEDQLRQWSRTIERYGLKLVEAYVTQISDIRERNAFQSCFPLRLAVAPPVVPDLERRVPLGTHTAQYFEYALLRKFDFIVDIEAAGLYPPQVDVLYSYRRSPFNYSQFVHRSGFAFVQVLGGEKGFLFLTNRLMAPGRLGSSSKHKEHQPAAEADKIRVALQNFCSDERVLRAFYEEEMAALAPAPGLDDPPPLSI
uniref:Vacuolar membrane-associated protein IML1 n=1 Tax=Mycena chlorophos TaxID=658473 RepID=A0ABQ0MAT0_MYCCL|nr:predicted protein [Mycena chlorophos]